MHFHHIGHIDAVSLSYSSSAMAPLSPNISRRYPSGLSNSYNSSLSVTPNFSSYKSNTAGYGHRLPRLATSSYSDSQQRYLSSPSTVLDLSKYSPEMYVPSIHRGSGLLKKPEAQSESKLGASVYRVPRPRDSSNEVTSNRRSNNRTRMTEVASLLESNDGDHGSDPTDADDATGDRGKTGPSLRANPLTNSTEPANTNKSPDSFVAQVPGTTLLMMTTSVPPEPASASTSDCVLSGKSNIKGRLLNTRGDRCGLNGLLNIGNTCFMNSVIQCLSNTRPLLDYLLNEQFMADINTTTSSMKGALMKAFSQVVQELWENDGDHVVNTSSLKTQIQRFAPRFMGYSQQDAQEFLRYLLEGLHEDVNRVTAKPQPILTDIPDNLSDSVKAVESWKRYLRSEDSAIVDIFVGQLRSSLRCTVCDHVSVTLDPFWDLSLPIPARSGTVKLSQCLEHFTKEEVLDGDEKPTCSKCQIRRKCTKSFSIQKFPKILVIHLSAFAAPRVQGCTYNLYGVANHSGTTHSGHYTAYCKHPYTPKWHEYNDNRVTSIPSSSVVTSEGYVLFYEQQPHNSHL